MEDWPMLERELWEGEQLPWLSRWQLFLWKRKVFIIQMHKQVILLLSWQLLLFTVLYARILLWPKDRSQNHKVFYLPFEYYINYISCRQAISSYSRTCQTELLVSVGRLGFTVEDLTKCACFYTLLNKTFWLAVAQHARAN